MTIEKPKQPKQPKHQKYGRTEVKNNCKVIVQRRCNELIEMSCTL